MKKIELIPKLEISKLNIEINIIKGLLIILIIIQKIIIVEDRIPDHVKNLEKLLQQENFK